MANGPHKLILLPNRSYQAVARSEIKKIANTVGFKPTRLAELEIVVAEITSNIIKHTPSGGELLVKAITGAKLGVEIIAIDAGPGLDYGAMAKDGASSTKTLGQGLGAIKRLSDEFDIYSLKNWGTVLLARIYANKDVAKKRHINFGAVMVPKDGETECGDNYFYSSKATGVKITVCDGLGHGPQASLAGMQCVESFEKHIELSPADQLKHIHPDAKKTRGAVMFTAHIDFANKQVMYCGVGNIAAKIQAAGRARSCVSYNGIVGHSIPGTLNNHVMQWSKNDTIILHSDGLSTKWDIQKYPNILKHDLTIAAAALYKDFNRKTDDVSVIVINQPNKSNEN